jgi:hypothetical protein
MGDAYTSSFGLGRKSLSPLLGEGLKLELDPRLQAWMGRMLLEGDIGRARTYALAPNWSGLEVENRRLFGPRISVGPGDPANVPVFRPLVGQPIPLCPTSKPPDPPQPPKPGEKDPEPKAADYGMLFKAVSQTEQYQCSVGRLFDSMDASARRDWRRLGAGEKALVITTGALIGGASLAGLLSNDEGRKLVLDKAIGADVPVPGVRGLQFKLLRSDEIPGQPKPKDQALRPVGIYFELDVLQFMQNFQRTPQGNAGR